MDRVRKEYQLLLRNSIIVFLASNDVSMTDIAGALDVDKSTISRVVNNPVKVDQKALIKFSKYFK
jgi:plasmid maintenance system antidote protein VapI